MSRTRHVNGVLLLYDRPTGLFGPGAVTVLEHVSAFREHSRFAVWEVNTHLGFPRALAELRFAAVVLHYSLFGTDRYRLDEDFLGYLAGPCGDSYKVSFFQDEFRYCSQRFAFLNDYGVDCVFSCLEPPYLEQVYGPRTRVSKLVSNVPGYVGEKLLARASRFSLPDAERGVDIGYRGRLLPAYAGRSGREKYEIGVLFADRATSLGLRLDIASGEEDRIYGEDWYRFVANCRAVLGTESSVDVFDLEGEVVSEFERIAEGGGEPTIEMLHEQLARWEGPIPYRVISPRHFEAAALGVCQILFEGRYSGGMEPMVHYIPLRKDFENFDEVIERFRDRGVRTELAQNARRDLIDSGEWSYASLVSRFDDVLIEAGVEPAISDRDERSIDATLRRGARFRLARAGFGEAVERARDSSFPGKRLLRSLAAPVLRRDRGT